MTVLAELIGEGKKFADESAVVTKINAQESFIDQLKGETAQLREQLTKALESSDRTTALEKLMAELKNNGKPVTPETPPTEGKTTVPPTLSQDDIVKIIEAREAAKAQERNLNTVLDKIKQVYGEKADEFFSKKAEELGLTVDELKALGRNSTTALTRTLGLDSRDTSTKSMTSSSHATIPVGASGEVRNKAYYEKLRKDMGTTKYILDRNLQIQLHKDMKRLGDAWDT